MPFFTPQDAPTKYISLANGASVAHRIIGPLLQSRSSVPLILHMHFRGNMDFWDPRLLTSLSATRQVIIFDQPGVGRSQSQDLIPTTFQGWADNLISFAEALGLKQFDLLGFSMGGAAVQMVALTRPDLIRNLILAGTTASAPGPTWKESDVGRGLVWPRDEPPPEPFKALNTARTPEETEHAIATSFFYHTPAGRQACKAYFARLSERGSASSEPVNLQLLERQKATRQGLTFAHWMTPNSHNSFDRLGELKMPVLVLNGDNDLLIPTSRSWELARRVEGAKLIIYPDAAHGFIWQYAERVGRDVNEFLNGDDASGAIAKL